MVFRELVKRIEGFDGLDFEDNYILKKDGEKLEIIIETNLQVIHHNHGYGEYLETYKTEYIDGDRWKLNYYINQDASELMKTLDYLTTSKAGNTLLFTKTEIIDTLYDLNSRGIRFHWGE